MKLASVRVAFLGPLDDLTLSLLGGEGSPVRAAVVLGGGGVGKTSLLAAIASTRPGYAVAQTRPRTRSEVPFAVTEWVLGDDDPGRPHPLRITSPNAKTEEDEEVALLRRREQTLFERRAGEGGFVVVAFSSARWFSRSPTLLTAPDRTVCRYDVRASASFDDATRADLARETKQALAYAAIGAALSGSSASSPAERERMARLERGMREVVLALSTLAGFPYRGVSPSTLEPVFEAGPRPPLAFDELPAAARHLVSFGALTVRALHAAYPDRDVDACEGVVLVDDVDLHQDARVQPRLVPLLKSVLPGVQWVLTTSSNLVASGCETGEVFALRRLTHSDRVELYAGSLAVTH
jgi:hypothetical protein